MREPKGVWFNWNYRAAIGMSVAIVVILLATISSTGEVHAQESACVTGGAVPAGNAALAADCATLLGMKATIRGSASLNWWTGRPIQQWNGIITTSSTATGAVSAVVGLGYPSGGLDGTLPAALGNLSALTFIDLSGNSLTGTIPAELGNLELVTLRLAGNHFTGCIPAALLNVANNDLDTLGLSTCGDDGDDGDDGGTVIPITTPTPPADESLSDMVKRVRPAVVKISGPGFLPYAIGTGFIFATVPDSGAAYILTNYHVVDEIEGLTVMVGDSVWYTPTVAFLDARRDIAVLSICCGEFVSVDFADSNTLFAGDEVVAVGYPQDVFMPRTLRPGRTILPGEASVTRGMISAFRYDSQMDAELVQTDAAINFGNSGGPLFSTDGQVVAMNTYGLDFALTDNLSFSVLETTIQEKLRIWAEGPDAEFGPLSGELHHELDGFIEGWRPDFEATDDEFQVAATFVNPYSTDDHDGGWNYGFAFGIADESNDQFMYFVVSSSKRWYLEVRRADGSLETVLSGQVPQLQTDAGQRNSLALLVDGKYGALYVNGLKVRLNDEPIGPYIDLGGELVQSHGGSVAVVTGYFTGSERAGAVTRYEDFYGVSYSHD